VVAVASALFFFSVFGLYRAVVRFTGPKAMVTVIAGVSLSVLVLAVMNERGQPLSALVAECMRLFPASGEINRDLSSDTRSVLARVRAQYCSTAE
jgi:mannose/fructose-specific phosphotransferase system component IIA